MHELSIALSIVDIVADSVKANGGGKVDAVYLKLGALSGVVKDALLFSWQMASADTPAEGSRLLIEDVPIVAHCRHCQEDRILDSIIRMICPVCHAPTPIILKGRELEVTALEIT